PGAGRAHVEGRPRREGTAGNSTGVSTVVALGGNALMRPGERGTAAEQLANLRRAVSALQPLLDERAADEAPALPLWLAVAQTQAEIGALIVAELRPALDDRPIACVLTHVRVGAEDPAFDRPTKPIGPFYSAEQGEQLERERGWAMVSDANRGHRRVVPSPDPLEIVELDVIRTLAEENTVVIACGGGGIPVVRRGNRLAGIDAVVDKDRASALLARGLEAERLLILTEVPAVYRRFGEPDQEEIRELSGAE